MLISKRSGNFTLYDDNKVINSILNANARVSIEHISRNLAAAIADEVFTELTENNDVLTTKDVREAVYRNLCDRGFYLTAKEYIEYKK